METRDYAKEVMAQLKVMKKKKKKRKIIHPAPGPRQQYRDLIRSYDRAALYDIMDYDGGEIKNARYR